MQSETKTVRMKREISLYRDKPLFPLLSRVPRVGRLALNLTLLIPAILSIPMATATYDCIRLDEGFHVQESESVGKDSLFQSTLYDLSTGQRFPPPGGEQAQHGVNIQRSPDG